MDNRDIAARFAEAADLLSHQQANPHRVEAYRRGARSVMAMTRPLADVYRESGVYGLETLPGIGRVMAVAAEELLLTGQWLWLDRLKGEFDPEAMLATVAGIGPGLAGDIHERLGINTLEDLEAAAHDGRLGAVSGMGPKRIRAVRETLATRLSRRGRRSGRLDPAPMAPPGSQAVDGPPVDTLLDIDVEYRRRAASGELRRIAPRRFNPKRKAWLPVLHTERDGHAYTALYSNTARAHRLGKTGDWVVIYQDGSPIGPWTVATETRGHLVGLRVVRGREAECAVDYARSGLRTHRSGPHTGDSGPESDDF